MYERLSMLLSLPIEDSHLLSPVQILPLIQSAVAVRLELAPALPGDTDLLYLDLALEQVVRGAIERGVGGLGMGAAAFVEPLLQNLVRSIRSRRCFFCLRDERLRAAAFARGDCQVRQNACMMHVHVRVKSFVRRAVTVLYSPMES